MRRAFEQPKPERVVNKKKRFETACASAVLHAYDRVAVRLHELLLLLLMLLSSVVVSCTLALGSVGTS